MTLKEIYQALGDGKKIRHETWGAHKYIYIASMGVLIYDDGAHYENGFLLPVSWSIYEELEDLKAKIVRTEVIAADFLRYQPGFAVAHISQLIDLKIKQAKL